MVIISVMNLREFLGGYQGGPAAFAAALGVSAQAVYRHLSGERLPRRAVMHRITQLTQGAVTAADFYGHGAAAPSAPPPTPSALTSSPSRVEAA